MSNKTINLYITDNLIMRDKYEINILQCKRHILAYHILLNKRALNK